MAKHFTRNTVWATKFCKTCNKNSRHAVSDRRITYCIECYERRQKKAEEEKQEPKAIQEGFEF